MSVKGKSFIIDAGHGGKYDGTTSGSRKEKVVTLNMSKILEKKLKAKGATIYMTRTTDKDFGGSNADDDVNKRVAYINTTFPKVSGLVSIHVNTAWTGRIGPFYQNGKTTSKNFTQAIATRYGTVPHEGDFAFLRDTTRTAATTLIELGQINEGWLDKTASLESTADFIIKGMEDYFAK